MIYKGAFFCDLDGTLAKNNGSISLEDKAVFEKLKDNNILRVIVTGRSPYSADKVIDASFPIDYLVCSTGCAVFKWPEKDLVEKHGLTEKEVNVAADALRKRKIDFMVLDEVPQNHKFSAHIYNNPHPDILRRFKIYEGFYVEKDYYSEIKNPACQLIGVTVPEKDPVEELAEELKSLKVLKATSPLDGCSIWTEIYPKHVSKGIAAKKLCEKLNIDIEKTAGVGNDYNDIDLLETVEISCVVSNAPDIMKQKYNTVPKCGELGVKEAAEKFISFLQTSSFPFPA